MGYAKAEVMWHVRWTSPRVCVLCIALVVLVLLLAGTSSVLAKKREVVGILAGSSGEVTVCNPAGDCHLAQNGEVIYRDDIIKTGSSAKSRARIRLMDKFAKPKAGPSIINMSRSTKLLITEYLDTTETRPAIEVLSGWIRSIFKGFSNRRSTMQVRTGGTWCGIRGTIYTVGHELDSGQSTVAVDQGQMVCSIDGGEERTVDAMEQLTVSRDGTSSIAAYDQAKMEQRRAYILGDWAADNDQACSRQRISGTYNASWGPIKCEPNEAGLECCYGANCKWSLRLAPSSNGQKLEGIWDHNDGRTGPVEFGLNEKCELSSGRYGYKAGELKSGWSVNSKSQEALAEPKKCEKFCVEWICSISGSGCSKIGNSCSGDTRTDNICGKGCKQAC